MLELNVQNILFLLCVGLFTAAAAVIDYRARRIPNSLTVPMFALGLVYHAALNGWAGPEHAGIAEAGLKSALLGFCIGFGPLFLLWTIGGGGGGDVKLMGALSVWLGFRMTLLVLIVSTLLVLTGTLAIMFWSMVSRGPYRTKRKFVATRAPSKRGEKLAKETLESRQKRRIMAYAVPVALATWLIVLWKLPQL